MALAGLASRGSPQRCRALRPWSHGRFDRGRTLRSVVMPGRVTVTAIPEAADGPREPIVRILEVEVGETTLEIGDE